MKPIKIVLTCEHGGNDVPDEYQHLFKDAGNILVSHRAQDFGTEIISDHLAQTLQCKYLKSTITRLLIDTNRSLNSPQCFSEYTKLLPDKEKQNLISRYYIPYRTQVANQIEHLIENNVQVLHISVHSFTANTGKDCEHTALSLLYDAKRHGEKEVARIWRNLISEQIEPFYIRLNYPFRNRPQSFVTYLKKQYPQQDYLGIELECNQNYIKESHDLSMIKQALSYSLNKLMEII